MQSVGFVLCLSLISVVLSKHIQDDRKGRLFRYSYTSTIQQPYVVTSLVPSSCVQIDATLPPCRNVRNFGNFPGLGWATNSTNTTQSSNAARNGTVSVESTPLSWGEYLGFVAPTVTVKSVFLKTTIVADPKVMVTFLVRGCRPLRLPAGLERCSISPSTTISQITPTSIISTQSSLIQMNALTNMDIIQTTEGEATSTQHQQSSEATQSLDTVTTI